MLNDHMWLVGSPIGRGLEKTGHEEVNAKTMDLYFRLLTVIKEP